jgi:hypothetical protein
MLVLLEAVSPQNPLHIALVAGQGDEVDERMDTRLGTPVIERRCQGPPAQLTPWLLDYKTRKLQDLQLSSTTETHVGKRKLGMPPRTSGFGPQIYIPAYSSHLEPHLSTLRWGTSNPTRQWEL